MAEQDKNSLEQGASGEPLPSAEVEEHVIEVAPVKRSGIWKSRRLLQILLTTVAILLVAGVGLYLGRDRIGGTRLGIFLGADAEHVHAQGETYYCPMHPDFKSDKPGNCPICSMKLVKLEKAPGSAGSKPATGAQPMPGMEMGPGGEGPVTPAARAIFIEPQRQQLIGVRSEPAVRQPLVKEIRAAGKVTYDETRVTHIHTKITGYIEQVFIDYVGKVVKSGEPLFTIYSPDLVATQEEYLLALRASRQFAKSSFEGVSGRTNSLLEAARRRLELWDITPAQIQELEKEGKSRRTLTVYSPVSGIVTERAAYHHGRYVSPEMDLYTIVDLSTIWITGEIYESELPLIKTGQTAEIEFPYQAGKRTLRGKITFVSPFLEEKTRTAKIRFEFPNSDFALKPEMFVNVKLKINLGNRLVVPEDSVLDTGTEQYVFVDKGNGYFEPRAVKLGPEADGRYAIEKGLEAGERVVTAANFILDSESRLKGAFAGMGKPGQGPQGGAAASQANLKIELMEPKAAKVGRNPVRLTVKDASGSPVTDAEVEVTLFMPQMGNMAPMTSKATLKPMGNGEYAGTIEIEMAWSWQTTVTVKKEGKSLGSIQTTITAR
jgi:membrane fusion protein, copper/silver efflux system